MSDFFADHGLDSTAATRCFCEMVGDPRAFRGDLPSTAVKRMWRLRGGDNLRGQESGQSLSLAVTAVLIVNECIPFVRNAGIEGVPTHEWDIVLGTDDSSITAVAVNASLRERWKAENLASCILKLKYSSRNLRIHTVILTRDEQEVTKLQEKIRLHEVEYVDKAVSVFSSDFDEWVEEQQVGVCNQHPEPGIPTFIKRTARTEGPIR